MIVGDWSFDTIRAHAATLPRRPLLPPCRCGWADDAPNGTAPVRMPVITLTNELGQMALETSPVRRTCAACTHPIHPGTTAVVHRLRYGAGVYNRYHAECVDLEEIR